MKRTTLFLTLTLILGCHPVFYTKVIWQSGQEGYHTFRIPALTVTSTGAILAFCEGRKNRSSDTGDIDLLMKRSTDNGKTWRAQQIIRDDAANTCGNPCPILDRDTGAIWLLMTWNDGDDREAAIIDQTSRDTRRVFVISSTDDGLSWSTPKELTDRVKQPNWTWYATGPGAGIQVERGPFAGRLVAPCDHIEKDSKLYYSHIIYSDDHGATWQLGGRTPAAFVNECQVVELEDGRLLLNMRNYDRSQNLRQIAYSSDGGQTWQEQAFQNDLIEPICQAALRRYCWGKKGEQGILLFSNPNSDSIRVNMTVKASRDDGQSWPFGRVLHAGPSAYSDLAVLVNGQIGCLYESGIKSAYEAITFSRISTKEVLSASKNRR